MTLCLPPRLALVGLRCSGKTTVGRILAERLGMDFIDLDERVAQAAGEAHAGEVIVRHGLKAFRALEAKELASALEHPARLVLSTGGGAIENEASRVLLRSAAVSVWLRASLDVLRARAAAAEAAAGAAGQGTLRPPIHTGPPRPGFQPADDVDEWDVLFARRAPLYREVARRAVDVDGLTPGDVALRVEQIWR